VTTTRPAPAISKTDGAILGMLTVEPMSGYDMKRFCEQSLAAFWHESYGNLYPRLGRLADAGLIRGVRTQRTRAPDAVVYSLTPRGRRIFARWLRQPPEAEQVRSEFVLKFFFGAHVPLDVTEGRMRDYEREQRAVAARYRAIEALIGGELGRRPDAPYWLMSLRRGQLLTRARLRWCRECRATLATIRRQKG